MRAPTTTVSRAVRRREWMKGMAGLALAWPQVAGAQPAETPRIDLGGLPTRVSSHPMLAAQVGVRSLHIKRDDEAGLVFGGSKARKLELLLAEASARRHRSVMTFGGVGSNHALATAVHARRLGLRAHLVLLPERPSRHARDHMLAALEHGAVLHAGTRRDRDEPARAVARFAADDSAYVIPQGGTSPLGNVGYVLAAAELAQQIENGELPRPDVIYVAAGTTGTAAGLWLGLADPRLDRIALVAVRASGRGTARRARVAAEVQATAVMLGIPSRPLTGRFELEHHFAGDGYAVPSGAGERAIRLCRRELALDPTYTAKAFAALRARAPRHRDHAVLFWNTFDARMPIRGEASVNDLPRGLRGYARE